MYLHKEKQEHQRGEAAQDGLGCKDFFQISISPTHNESQICRRVREYLYMNVTLGGLCVNVDVSGVRYVGCVVVSAMGKARRRQNIANSGGRGEEDKPQCVSVLTQGETHNTQKQSRARSASQKITVKNNAHHPHNHTQTTTIGLMPLFLGVLSRSSCVCVCLLMHLDAAHPSPCFSLLRLPHNTTLHSVSSRIPTNTHTHSHTYTYTHKHSIDNEALLTPHPWLLCQARPQQKQKWRRR